jgi:hypothetical protein
MRSLCALDQSGCRRTQILLLGADAPDGAPVSAMTESSTLRGTDAYYSNGLAVLLVSRVVN